MQYYIVLNYLSMYRCCTYVYEAAMIDFVFEGIMCGNDDGEMVNVLNL